MKASTGSGVTYHFPLAVAIVKARDAARRYLLKQIGVTIAWMPPLQGRFRHRLLTRYFQAATFCGEEEFYFLAIPTYMWFFDAGNSVPLVLLFLFNTYLGNWLKNLFCLPRPPLGLRPGTSGAEPRTEGLDTAPRPAPRVFMEKDRDFGWPSTHSMNAVALPFYLLRCAFPIAVWDYSEPYRMWLAGLVATTWALSVSVSRVYLGVHSPADVQGGMMLGAVVLRLWLSVHRSLHAWVVGGGFSDHGVPVTLDTTLVVTVAAAAAVLAHPVVVPRSTTFLESVAIVGFAHGFVLGAIAMRGNAADACEPAHHTAANVAACAVVGGLLIFTSKACSRQLMRCGPAPATRVHARGGTGITHGLRAPCGQEPPRLRTYAAHRPRGPRARPAVRLAALALPGRRACQRGACVRDEGACQRAEDE